MRQKNHDIHFESATVLTTITKHKKHQLGPEVHKVRRSLLHSHAINFNIALYDYVRTCSYTMHMAMMDLLVKSSKSNRRAYLRHPFWLAQ